MQRASDTQKPRSIATDGLIVAGATAAAYLLTFAYEYGYCSYFGIPGFLIEPSTGTVLFTALCILLASVLLIDASYLPRELLAALPWRRLRIRLVLVVFIWGAPALMGRPFHWLLVLNLLLWTLVLLSDYLFALLLGSGTVAERIATGEKNTSTSRTSWDGPIKVVGTTAVGLILMFLLTTTVAGVAGTVHARFQEGFVVLKSTPDMAVIKRYGDRFVVIRYAGSPPQATGEFKVLDGQKDTEFLNLEGLSIKAMPRWVDRKATTKN